MWCWWRHIRCSLSDFEHRATTVRSMPMMRSVWLSKQLRRSLAGTARASRFVGMRRTASQNVHKHTAITTTLSTRHRCRHRHRRSSSWSIKFPKRVNHREIGDVFPCASNPYLMWICFAFFFRQTLCRLITEKKTPQQHPTMSIGWTLFSPVSVSVQWMMYFVLV